MYNSSQKRFPTLFRFVRGKWHFVAVAFCPPFHFVCFVPFHSVSFLSACIIVLSMIAWISSFALPPGLLLDAARVFCYDVAASFYRL